MGLITPSPPPPASASLPPPSYEAAMAAKLPTSPLPPEDIPVSSRNLNSRNLPFPENEPNPPVTVALPTQPLSRSEVESQTKTSGDSKDSKDTVAIVPQNTVLHLPSSNIKVEMEVLDHLFKKTNSENQIPGKLPISGSKYPPLLPEGCLEGKGVGSSNNNGLHSLVDSLMSAKPAPAAVSKPNPRDVAPSMLYLATETNILRVVQLNFTPEIEVTAV